MVKQFTDPLAISRRSDFKLKISNVAAGRQMSLMLGKHEKGNRKQWVVYATGANQFGQLGSHKTPFKPRDTSGNEIEEQFDERGKKRWTQGRVMSWEKHRKIRISAKTSFWHTYVIDQGKTLEGGVLDPHRAYRVPEINKKN